MALVNGRASPVDLLVTDVIMPSMNGVELAERLTEAHTDVKVLFLTGYAEGRLPEEHASRSDVVVMTKPFGGAELLAKVREVLDAK